MHTEQLIVICSWCPDAKEQERIAREQGGQLTHTICPTCFARVFAEEAKAS